MKYRPRTREIGIKIGKMPTGEKNALIDVPSVKVGHVTLIYEEVRTGVTAILPHDGNIYDDKVVATTYVINGYGKSLGLPQINELGNIETPVLLTNTLNVWRVADAVVDFMSDMNPNVYSFNPVVGECNDSFLNNILNRSVKREHVFQALNDASENNTLEGNVGAGTGMSGFRWKGGIGTSSRIIGIDGEKYVLGVLVVNNAGSAKELIIDGIPVGEQLTPPSSISPNNAGSIMIIIATDAPLSSRQLKRIAKRVSFGLSRTGLTASHGSGDFVIAFSAANLISSKQKNAIREKIVYEPHLSFFFKAVIEATEESVINSLFKAETMTGRDGNVRHAIPIDEVKRIIREYRYE